VKKVYIMDDKVEPILEKTKTLIIRRLPAELKPEDQEDLLRHFGAEYVRCMGSSGRLKNVAFATYANVKEAEAALRRLHQLEVLGSRLVVEFSSSKYSDLHPTELPPIKKQSVISDDSSNKKPEQCKRESTEDRKQSLLDKVHAISPKWGVNYPLDPRLRYAYPAPTLTILTNIANAMAAVPRFYVQVLHLMNKMNLPAPFGLPTLTPPLPLGVQPPQPPDMPAPPMPQEDMDFSSSTESELESEDEDTVKKSTTEAGSERENGRGDMQVEKDCAFRYRCSLRCSLLRLQYHLGRLESSSLATFSNNLSSLLL
jgi:U11/U12 small nuclear ribonucleoprotein SNRNP65